MVAGRLNLTSTEALTRIGESVNERYEVVCGSLGLQTTVRDDVTATTTIGDRNVTFVCEKIYALYDPSSDPPRLIPFISWEEMRLRPIGTDPPQAWTTRSEGSRTVQVRLSSEPATEYDLLADAERSVQTLEGEMEPRFSKKFHNLLVYGAMATELDKNEKPDLAAIQEKRYDIRLSELRMHIAKNAFQDFYQGKTAGTIFQPPSV